MVRFINLHWNNRFTNPMQLHLLCVKTGAVALVQQGLTAGRLTGWQASKQM